MELLVDTHVALWWALDPTSLLPQASELIARSDNTVFFSAASAWELAIKVRSGKLTLNVTRLIDQLARDGFRMLGIGLTDAITAGELEWAHRDPFDRMLVAQSRTQRLQLVTRDEAIRAFLGSESLAA